MTYEQMDKAVKTFMINNIDILKNKTVAIRYDNKPVNVGETLEESKSNANRDDDRDFPEYGSKEYNDAEYLDGTCAYALNDSEDYTYWINDEEEINDFFEEYGLNGDGIVCKNSSLFNHCSIVIGDINNDCMILREDSGEIILNNCEVVEILW